MNIKELAEKVSPLPWKKTEHNARIIVSSDKSHYAACGGGSSEELADNARFLRHAANNILPLVEAVEKMFEVMPPENEWRVVKYNANYKALKHALKNAQEVE